MAPAKPITPDQKGGGGREWLTEEGAEQRRDRGTQQPTGWQNVREAPTTTHEGDYSSGVPRRMDANSGNLLCGDTTLRYIPW